MKNLSERDSKYLWHPLTQHKTHPGMLGISSASGVYLRDEEGNKYIDAISSWYTCMYGHCNEYITERVSAQMKRLDQVVFSGFTHEPAVTLAESLMEVLPDNQQKLFFSDNGSTSVEVAIKMALQYHFNKGEKRNVLIALEDGFHGDTFGAMSVSGLSVYNGPFEDFFLKVVRVPRPTTENLEEVISLVNKIHSEYEVAAFVYEPLVQGAAAMKMMDADVLESVLKTVRKHGTVLIADEVMTGFGKTGTYFASDQMDTKPDLMCLSKALTAGLLPMGLTSCTREIYDAFYSDKLEQGFFHGHTYTANPLACTAASAALELLRTPEIQNNIQRISRSHEKFSNHIKEHPKVGQCRQRGVIFALDLNIKMDRYGKLRDTLYQQFMDRGVFLRPLGNTIYTMPPYVIEDNELNRIYEVIEEVLNSN